MGESATSHYYIQPGGGVNTLRAK